MLAELKFAQGAINKKDLLPALSHFAIDKGRVRSYNGVVALCTPIALDLECKPKAEPMVRAIGHCDETVTLARTPAGKLSIKSGAFRALIECLPDEQVTPHVEPEGEPCAINGGALLQAVKACEPFIGEDASRPFSNGVLLKGRSAFATNNVTAVEYWVGGDADFPNVVTIPQKCVQEMIRINEAPTHAQFASNSVTFHYSGDRWIRTQLLSTDWPDISVILDKTSNPQPLDKALFTALAKIKPFLDKYTHVYFQDGCISTTSDKEEGTYAEIPGFRFDGLYTCEQLEILRDAVERIDWTGYPGPCMFFGPQLRGAIIGRHKK